ncbi:MAG TPA: GNAT family N-acetyltransferase [Gaiellales bacterium]|jgi:aminoglycoside 6'-N-acetyltransferase I
MAIEIRRAGRGDAALFARIADGVFDLAVTAAVLEQYLATPGHHLVVALDDGEVVGQAAAMLHRHPDERPVELYVDELGVAPSHRRRGIARLLLDELFTLGRELGCREAWVGTEHDNVAARTLYEARGAVAEPFAMYVYEL